MTKVCYPAGPVTPHGRYHIRKGDFPEVSLMAPNDQIVLWLMGGHAIPDPFLYPEVVHVTKIAGLISPWETIDEHGATEDGVSFVDALYGPTEVDIEVKLVARDAKHLRRLRRHLFECLDVKRQSELGFMTHELGYWWAPIRWWKKPDNAESGPQQCTQVLTLRLRGDSGFWQSYPDLASFGFIYEDMKDEFDVDYNTERDLGPNWPQYYDGDGGGYQYAQGGLARWLDDPDDIFLTQSREVVNGPYKDYSTTGDNQVVSMMLGAIPEWSFPEQGANDVWARMGRNVDGSWNGNGVRARVQIGAVSLTAFVNFVPVWDRTVNGLIIPWIGDEWSLVAGYENDPRLFKILRQGAPILQYKEPTATSHVGAAYRGVGFGVRAGGALFTQATPATVRRITTGDNDNTSQSGFLKRHNAGDQDAYDEYTLYGPFVKAKIANGPGSTDFIEFGPLAVGEIAHIRTDPRRKQVFDYTDRTGNAVAPALFGANPTDGMARRMKGRFTSDCAIPAKEPGMRVREYQVACSIQGGNADSRIDAQLTPLRRYPQ